MCIRNKKVCVSKIQNIKKKMNFYFTIIILLLLVVSSILITSSRLPERQCVSSDGKTVYNFMSKLPNNNKNVCIDQFEAAILVMTSGNEWTLHPFNMPLDNLVSQNIPFRAISSRDPVVKPNAFKPQAYINQLQSTEACLRSGKRLCTSEEFLLGCGGSQNLTYPYGNTYELGVCNVNHLPSPIQRLFGPDATYNLTEMNDPRCDLLSNTLDPGGEYSRCTNNETNTYDMAGNLDEWVSDIQPNGHGIFRGGYFCLDDDQWNGHGCRYITIAHAPNYHDYSLGFRCCLDL
jgi:formylglycine-generating enzyme